jgi:hypothetical protein
MVPVYFVRGWRVAKLCQFAVVERNIAIVFVASTPGRGVGAIEV